MGDFFALRKGRRDRVVIATKFFCNLFAGDFLMAEARVGIRSSRSAKGRYAVCRPTNRSESNLMNVIQLTALWPVIDMVFAFKEAKQSFARLQNGDYIGKMVIRTGSIEAGTQ